MGFYRCVPTQSGGELKETVLWTNPNPTSNFSSQNITLNQSLDNFDYIKIYSRASTSVSTESNVIMSVTDFQNIRTSGGTGTAKLLIGNSSSYSYVRYIYWVSNTVVNITQAMVPNVSGQASTSADIPIKISGLKF